MKITYRTYILIYFKKSYIQNTKLRKNIKHKYHHENMIKFNITCTSHNI